MDPELVLNAVSVALTKWSGVLFSPKAADAKEGELKYILQCALSIDVDEAGLQNNREFKCMYDSRAYQASKTQGDADMSAPGPGHDPGSVPGKVNYCVSEVA